jgi:hypothetical protein
MPYRTHVVGPLRKTTSRRATSSANSIPKPTRYPVFGLQRMMHGKTSNPSHTDESANPHIEVPSPCSSEMSTISQCSSTSDIYLGPPILHHPDLRASFTESLGETGEDGASAVSDISVLISSPATGRKPEMRACGLTDAVIF